MTVSGRGVYMIRRKYIKQLHLLGDHGEVGHSGAPHLVLEVCAEVRTDATAQGAPFVVCLHVGNRTFLLVEGELPIVYEIPQGAVRVLDLDHFFSHRNSLFGVCVCLCLL